MTEGKHKRKDFRLLYTFQLVIVAAQQVCKNTQALRVIGTACQHISKGNTRGNKEVSLHEKKKIWKKWLHFTFSASKNLSKLAVNFAVLVTSSLPLRVSAFDTDSLEYLISGEV